MDSHDDFSGVKIAFLRSFAPMPAFTISAGQIIGSYRVIRLLGEGGMGAVYEAVHTTLNRRCAIKVLHPQYAGDPIIAARFLQEAKAANLVQHPGVVQIFEFGQFPEGPAYFVMEFLEGDTLNTRIKRAAQLPTGRMGLPGLATCWAIAKVCAVVHKQGLVHRDLKPANIMIVPDPDVPGGERIKVLDFGIVKATQAGDDAQSPADIKTRTGSVMGTPQFMAPEQWRGQKNIDGKADVYALGIILYLIVAGLLPFDHDDLPVLGMMHCFNDPPLLTSLDPNLPPAVAALGSKMLEKDPIKRPSMSEVASALKQILGIMFEAEHHPLAPVPALPSRSSLAAERKAEPPTLDSVLLESSVSPARKPSTPHPSATPPAEVEQHDTNPDIAGLLAQRATAAALSEAERQRRRSGDSVPVEAKKELNAPLRAPFPITPKQVRSSTAPTLQPQRRRSWHILLLLAFGIAITIGAWAAFHAMRPSLPSRLMKPGSVVDLAPIPDFSEPVILPDFALASLSPDLAMLPDLSTPEPLDLEPAEPPRDMAKHNKLPVKPSAKPLCVPNLPTEACIVKPNLSVDQRDLIIKAFKRSAAKLCIGERLVLRGLPAAPQVTTVPPSMERANGATRALTLTLRGLLGGNEFPSQVEIQCSAQ